MEFLPIRFRLEEQPVFPGVPRISPCGVLSNWANRLVMVTPSLLLAVAAIPLGESIRFISKVEYAPGFPLLLCGAKPFVGWDA